MAIDRKKPGKSESLTIRMNPRTRFILEFVARMRGQTITTVVERALEAAGDQVKIARSEFEDDLTWKDFWDVSDGVRALKVAAEPELFPTYEEERRLAFTKQFREYFYKDANCKDLLKTYVEILWPRIDEFVEYYEETKTKEFFAVERMMRSAIESAKVKPPVSRSGVKDPTRPPPTATNKEYDLDDDIPF